MIVRTAFVALAVAVPSLALVAPAAAQVDEVASGIGCGLSVMQIYNSDDLFEIDGGPVVATAPGATIAMTCTVQVGTGNVTHAGPDALAVSSAESPQVTVLPPTLAWYPMDYGSFLALCTQATVDGVAYYLDAQSGDWSTDSGVQCAEMVGQSVCPFTNFECYTDWDDLVFQPLEDVLGPWVNQLLCPVLGLLAPGVPGVKIGPGGDVRLADTWEAWDCTTDGLEEG